MSVSRSFRAQVSGAKLRTETFDGREHLVVPVVALVEGVLHAVNSPYPELVLAEEFSAAPQGWNGRPVLGDHPVVNGTQVSANEPSILESQAFGLIFNAGVSNDKLMLEAWIDTARAGSQDLGSKLLARLATSATVEVSVGVFVRSVEETGTYGDREYRAVWRDIVPDHLALLPEGSIGACSVADGCGAPRAARRGAQPMTRDKRSLRDRLKTLLGFSEMSDKDVRNALEDAIREKEPRLAYVTAVYDNDPTNVHVVYVIYDPGDYSESFWMRSYSIDAAGKVTVADTRTEVEPVTRWEPVNGTAVPEVRAAACSCGGRVAHKEEKREESTIMATKKERVKALVDNAKSPFTAEDTTYLEGLPEARLVAFEQAAETKSEEIKAETKAAAAAPKALTVEEYLANAPTEVREALNEGLRAASSTRAALIAGLKATQRCPFTDTELATKSLAELQQLTTLAAVPTTSDYSALLPSQAAVLADPNETASTPPDGYKIALARRSGQAVN